MREKKGEEEEGPSLSAKAAFARDRFNQLFRSASKVRLTLQLSALEPGSSLQRNKLDKLYAPALDS